MNWLTNFARPKVKAFFSKRNTPDNLWVNCTNCGSMVFHRDLIAQQFVCPSCQFHMRIGPTERFKAIFDGGRYETFDLPDVLPDPLKFKDEKKYADRIKESRSKTSQTDAVVSATGTLDGLGIVMAVQNFKFMGGSLGMAAGEALIRSAEVAIQKRAPFILFTAAGGARMQEGILSLMQMPRTTIAVQMLHEAKLPYIVVLTDPTTGGVTASYAMLGDVQIAEPGALIGFAGPRVIEQTIREKLPEGFQRSEYLLEHGMLDMVVHRHDLRKTLSHITHLLMDRSPGKSDTPPRALDPGAHKIPSGVDRNNLQADHSIDSEISKEEEQRARLAGQTP